jgi:hypothetical protein
MMKRYLIGIYQDDEMELLSHIVKTIEEASKWIGCSIDTLYKAKHEDGIMRAKGYKLELIKNEEIE